MENIIVKHLNIAITTDVEIYKTSKKNFNSYLYNRICNIVESELEEKVNGLYHNCSDGGRQHSSTNIVIKKIKINLDKITIGKNLLSSFSKQLSSKLSEEFDNNIKEDFREQHDINLNLYIEKTCNDLKDFLLDGCIENENSYEQLVKNYDSILNIYLNHDIKKISSFNLKDFLSLCFSMPNAYRRFIRVFPKNIVEKTISILFKDNSYILYRIVDEVSKIIPSVEGKKQKNIFPEIKVTDIFANVDRSIVNSIEHIQHIDEELKSEIYASIFEHYERFGYIKRNAFLDSLLDIINVKNSNGFNLTRENNNILVVKETENMEIAHEENITTDQHVTDYLISELYDNISRARNGDSKNLLSFFEKNSDNLKNRILYLNTKELFPLLSEIDFNDLDISPLLYLANENIIDSYNLLRNTYVKRKKDVNKGTLKFLCTREDDTHNITNTGNVNDTQKTYFHFLFKTLEGIKGNIKMLKDYYGECELLSTLIPADIQGIDIENNKKEDIDNHTIDIIDKIDNIQNDKEIKGQNDNLLENRNNSTAEEKEDDNILNSSRSNKEDNKNKDTLESCANIISRFLTRRGLHLQKVDIKPIEEDDDIFFSFISSSVINHFLQFKNGLTLISSFYNFCEDNKASYDDNLSLLNKLTEEIYSFATVINDEKLCIKTESTVTEKEITYTSNKDTFLGLNVNVVQFSFTVYNKFMFALGDDHQRLKNTFSHIYTFLKNVNEAHVIDPSILLLNDVKKDKMALLDKCLTNVLKKEMVHITSPMNVGTMKIKNKNNVNVVKNFKKLLDNISISDKANKLKAKNIKTTNISKNITEENVITFIKDPYTPCGFCNSLRIALENDDIDTINKAMSIACRLDAKKQYLLLKAIYDTFSHQEYNKIANIIITSEKTTPATTLLYDFIKSKSKNEEKKKLFLPVLLYVLKDKKNAQEERYNNLQNARENKDNNYSSTNYLLNRLKNNSYSALCRDVLSLFYIDYKYNDSQLTHVITENYNFYNNNKIVYKNASNYIITSLYLHKIIELLNALNSSEEITPENNILKDIKVLEEILLKNNTNEKTWFPIDNNNTNIKNHNENDNLGNGDIENLNENDNLVNSNIENINENNDSEDEEYKQELVKEIYIHNGGLIFLYPFFVDYLTKLSLWDSEKQDFVDKYSQDNAIHALQYMITSKVDNVEWKVILNKLLCGKEYNENISAGYALDDDKKKRKQQLNILKKLSVKIIKTCIDEWGELQKMKKFKDFARGFTVSKFKEYFLNRAAMIKVYKITSSTDSFLIYVVELSTKIYDEEIATIPWVIDKIQLPWMKKPIHITNLIIKHKNE